MLVVGIEQQDATHMILPRTKRKGFTGANKGEAERVQRCTTPPEIRPGLDSGAIRSTIKAIPYAALRAAVVTRWVFACLAGEYLPRFYRGN